MLVLVETDTGGATEVSRETLTFARRLEADVHALVVGDGPPGLVDQLGAYGVTVVHHADGEAFTSYAGAAWAAACVGAVAAAEASVVMAAGTQRGNEVLAHVACRLDVTMAANVVEVGSLTPLVVSRQVLGGAALEEMRLEDSVAVVSVAGHACDPTEAETSSTPVVRPLDVSVSDADLRARVVRTEPGEPDESGGLKSARVVVGAGRGAGSADGFGDLLELTELLGGVPRRLPRRDQPRLAAASRAGRPDRQPGRPRPLHRVRDQRRHPALGGHVELQDDPGDQHGRGRTDGHQGALRGGR